MDARLKNPQNTGRRHAGRPRDPAAARSLLDREAVLDTDGLTKCGFLFNKIAKRHHLGPSGAHDGPPLPLVEAEEDW